MKYIVYLTINTKSDSAKFYVGVHRTENPNIFDGYIGCGIYINQPSTYMYPKTPFQYAVKKYGPHAFKRITLYEYDVEADAYKKEAEIVDETFIKQSFTYNVSLGGSHCLVYKTLYQFDAKGNLIKAWDKLNEACELYGVTKNQMNGAISGKNILKNYFWSRESEINIQEYSTKGLGSPKLTYLYSSSGKLQQVFNSANECAKFIGVNGGAVTKAIQNQRLVANKYYVSNSVKEIFVPKARANYMNEIFYVYNIDGTFIGNYKGKEVMPVISLHSWNGIRDIIERKNRWFKNFYLADQLIDHLPEKYDLKRIKVDVYDNFGKFIETADSIKDVKQKYNIPSAKIKNLELGEKHFNNYIFKYHSSK